MASILRINNLDTASGSTITIPTGKQLIGTDSVSIKAPGMVVQVLSQEITAYTGTGSTSLVATGFTLTITPKYSNSKIKCTAGFNGFYANTVGSGASFQLYKNGSSLVWLNNISGYAHPSGQAHQVSCPVLMHMDTAGSTNATTYAIFFARAGGSGNIFFNNYLGSNNQTRSWFTVEEIAQ